MKKQPTEITINILRRIIYTYSFWTAILSAILLVIALYYFGRNTPYEGQIYAIASGLASSIIFSVFFTLLTNREFLNLVKHQIKDERDVLVDYLMTQIKDHYSNYKPSEVFPPTAGIDYDFNRELTQDLKRSSFYLFRGVSAKYVPARILYTSHSLSVLKIITLDPNNNRAVNLRARDRLQNPKYSGSTIGHLTEGVRQEIFTSIIALFDCRHICPIEIAYSQGTSVTRLEIFDSSLYLSLYHTEKAMLQAFPETMRYEKNSLPYQIHRLDSFREFDLCDKHIRFQSSDGDSDLVQHLSHLGMPNVSLGLIDQYRTEYQDFANDFVRKSKISMY